MIEGQRHFKIILQGKAPNTNAAGNVWCGQMAWQNHAAEAYENLRGPQLDAMV